MNRLFAGLALSAAVVATAAYAAPLAIGANAPDISTQTFLAGKETDFRLTEALRKGPVVLYFFPAAFTPGCTLEAQAFSNAHDEFAKAGATVLGLTAGSAPVGGMGGGRAMLTSADADFVKQLAEFSTKECAGKFAVGGATPAVINGYGVASGRGTNTSRTSFVITPDRKIALEITSNQPDVHITQTLAKVKALKAG